MLALLAVGLLTSCEKNEPQNGIVGTWSCSNHYYGGADTYTFNSNGTYTWSCTSTYFSDDSGHYAFDKSRSTLTIQNRKGTTWIYVIVSLTSSSFTMMDEDGDTYFYSKK